MSRTNISVLIATALLGVLLVVVLRLTGSIGNLPFLDTAMPPAAESVEQRAAAPLAAAGLPEVSGAGDIAELLSRRGLDPELLLAQSASWYQSRGFLGADPLLGIKVADAPLLHYESLDDATLAGLGETGDMAATQMLASRRASIDPDGARQLYVDAAELGSIFAYFQLASLEETLAAVRLLGADDEQSKPASGVTAFAYSMAALREGGPPVIDPAVLQWTQQQFAALSPSMRGRACELSEKIVIDFSLKRRERGQPPIRSNPPPVFLGVSRLDPAELPCADTPFAYRSLVALDSCSTMPVAGPRGEARTLYICYPAS